MITTAIPTAREIVVGDIVTSFHQADLHLGADQGARDYALRVTHVLRGGAKPGDLMDVQYLLPNWPQTRFSGGNGPAASCTYLRATPGEVIALAFDALQPGGRMREGGLEWIQPPTRYSAVGVIIGTSSTASDTWQQREIVTLQELRDLASLPPTDTMAPVLANPPQPVSVAAAILVAAAVMGFWCGWRRSGGGRRVAPDGVRRSER
jgi:hypothetical protein